MLNVSVSLYMEVSFQLRTLYYVGFFFFLIDSNVTDESFGNEFRFWRTQF